MAWSVEGRLAIVFFVLGWLAAGFSVVGQPHVMVRFMSLNDEKNMQRTRAWYYGFFVLFYILAAGLGMLFYSVYSTTGVSETHHFESVEPLEEE